MELKRTVLCCNNWVDMNYNIFEDDYKNIQHNFQLRCRHCSSMLVGVITANEINSTKYPSQYILAVIDEMFIDWRNRYKLIQRNS